MLTLYTSFQAGGFFVGTPALLATVMGVLLVLRITLAERPFEGFNRPLAVAVAALGAYAVWTLGSAFWSDAPARALVEFDRALLYWFTLVLFGSLPRTHALVAWTVRALTLAIVVVCGVALVTRLFPAAIEVAPDVARRRLSYPLTYWNALGVMAAIGVVFGLHLTASEREPPAVRLAGAAALPLLACTLYFTFSRGAILAGLVGIAAYAVLAHPRALITAMLAAGPPVGVAIIACYRADLLAGERPTSAAAAAQGEDAALVAAVCILAATVLRALLLPVDRRLSAISVSHAARRRVAVATGAMLVAVAVVTFTAFDGSTRLSDAAAGFTERGSPDGNDFRGRLTQAGSNGRVKQWEVALDAFSEAPVLGLGAGKYGGFWFLERDRDLKVEDAHSLYLESMAELGLVGLGLILIFVLCVVVGTALRARGDGRHLYAGLFAALLVWSLHAGIDWDWEMPAVTLWVFALSGMAMAGATATKIAQPGRMVRVAASVGCLALAVPTVLVAVSQRELNESVQLLKRGECASAIDPALAAARAVPVRPEPFEVLGFCDVRLGEPQLAVRMLEAAVERDPASWEAHYGLALTLGAAGRDPRGEAARALQLNPRDPLARDAVRRFRTTDPRKWRRRALGARLPLL